MKIKINGRYNFGQLRQLLLEKLHGVKPQSVLIDLSQLTLIDYYPGFDNYADYISDIIGQAHFEQVAFVSISAIETAFFALVSKNLSKMGSVARVFSSCDMAEKWM